jgi:hypothetical protein
VLGTGTLMTAWVFTVGWTYLHTYYRHFGVNINSLNFAPSQYFVFAFVQFVSFPNGRFLLGALSVCAAVLVAWSTLSKRLTWLAVLSVLYLLLLLGGFRTAYRQAHEAALKDMQEGSSLPRILLQMKKDNNSKYNMIDQIIRSPDLRILIEDDDRLLVFVPKRLNAPTAIVRVLEVRHQEVLYSVRTTTVPTS